MLPQVERVLQQAPRTSSMLSPIEEAHGCSGKACCGQGSAGSLRYCVRTLLGSSNQGKKNKTPGADIPDLPSEAVDSLVAISGIWQPPPPTNFVGPGAMLILKTTADVSYCGVKALFAMGMMVPDSAVGYDQGSFIVDWWVPRFANAETFRRGRNKQVVDIFGPWEPYENLSQDEASQYVMPLVICNQADVLIANVELEKGRIPFPAFVSLRMAHGIDTTALSVSQTHYGNLYRAFVLMSAPA